MKSDPAQMGREELLRGFQDNAGCIYTYRKAHRYLRHLGPYLTERQGRELWLAWEHHRIGEGREGIDKVCEEIREEWTRHG